MRALIGAAAALPLAIGAGVTISATGASAQTSPDYRAVCANVTTPGIAHCLSFVRTDVKARTESALHGQAPVGYGYGPSTFRAAYDLPSTTAGAGQVVAVVDAYNDPDAVSDLATYRSAWGEPACNKSTEAGCLTVVNQSGATSPLPKNAGSTGWDVEESLDVDMVSAVCANCHIYLVEATSPSTANLGTGVDSAVSVDHARFVSNSYGENENSGETSADKYYNHAGVAVTVSAGDDGYGVEYPASSHYVTAVGGTTLSRASGTSRGYNETVWSGTGSGCSKFEAKPTWQTHSGCSHRINNDVAADANPNTGAAIYDTYSVGGWEEVGGTSESSPIIASVFALAGTPAAGTYPSSYPYTTPSALYDVTSGSNGSCSTAFLCHAETGYDGPTGLGAPDGLAAFTAPTS